MGLIIRDFLSPALRRIARRIRGPRPVLEAMGLQLASITARSFNNPSLRVTPWPKLAPSTIAAKKAAGKASGILKRDLALWRSWVRPDLTYGRSHVTLRSDRPYAGVHQSGAPSRNVPARPMLPFIGSGDSARLAPFAREKIQKVAQAKMNALLREN